MGAGPRPITDSRVTDQGEPLAGIALANRMQENKLRNVAGSEDPWHSDVQYRYFFLSFLAFANKVKE